MPAALTGGAKPTADPLEVERSESEETLACWALLDVGRVACATARRWVRRAGSALALWRAPDSALRALRPPLPSWPVARERALRDLERLRERGIQVLAPGSPRFPAGLRTIPDPPLLLFARGGLPTQPALAMVGSRRATARSRAVAEGLACAVSRAGAAVVSGLAYGIDAAAHRGCLAGGAPTVAVLASGLDHPSPRGNRALADRILDLGGAWLSEYPPGQGARAEQFPERNRLISGLACAVLIVEARERSGSLWTARHALEQGRDVLAVPGPIDTDAHRGSNRLLREGAAPALDAQDLLDALFGIGARRAPGSAEESAAHPGRSLAARVLDRLRDGPMDVDALAAALELSAAELGALLLELELEGHVERLGARVSPTRVG